MARHTCWRGLEPVMSKLFQNCPAVEGTVIEVLEGTLGATNTRITSPVCRQPGWVIVALVAVATAPSLAGSRESQTIVIGRPPDAAARNCGVAGPLPGMEAELELRKAICACAALASVMPASAPISSTARKIPRCQRRSACLRVVRVAFIVISSCFHTLPALACKKSPTGL